ncbi:putative hydrolase of the HAD superfamily [Nakamurella panacisegetis]|uniref:Putative hydrolase of the HAD superfamily n=2 Tax=Nakamurella panacisegetis TaxID=1090615 RepID=A0A1H0L1N1_9ACTN|nr:HAD family hydrolase [Nakamurella panacisegetis]SDO61985.1 putative hydrolase of the HAD superfamily [Nakamurella panacisegetis]
MNTARRSLIFDADDTLWENNVLFERVVEDYLDWLAHPTLSRPEIRSVLDDIEAANVKNNGYGSRAFLGNLAQTFERLYARPVTDAQRAEIEDLAAALLHHDIELMPGVADVLGTLGTRHDLFLLTKGDQTEQRRKLDASGLAHHFAAVHIVPEKDPDVYREVTVEHGLINENTWMIGNSPKSDILPARAAGLNAVFIPHVSTWVLEHSEIPPDDRVLRLPSFTALLDHF